MSSPIDSRESATLPSDDTVASSPVDVVEPLPVDTIVPPPENAVDQPPVDAVPVKDADPPSDNALARQSNRRLRKTLVPLLLVPQFRTPKEPPNTKPSETEKRKLPDDPTLPAKRPATPSTVNPTTYSP